MQQPPNILTIAGSDSGGGAGIQADLKTIQALGGYGVSAITAVTAQNGARVAGIFPVSADFVATQLATIREGFPLRAAKTGMLFARDIIHTVADFLKDRTFPLVVDPVSVSQSGGELLQRDAVETMQKELLPVADLITPNIPEAEMLTGIRIQDERDILEAGAVLLGQTKGAVLIKGGHRETGILVTDYLFEQGAGPKALPKPHISTQNNHGTGCTLSAAIATCLAMDLPLQVSVTRAQEFLNQALVASYAPGIGAGPVNHAWMFSKK